MTGTECAKGGLSRRLGPGDARHLEAVNGDCAWISKTWGGPAGLAASSAAWAAVCADVLARGRTPTWTTAPDSRAIAERLGFAFRRRDVLHVVGIPVPPP